MSLTYRHRLILFFPDDAAALTALLKDRHPGIRFVPFEYDALPDRVICDEATNTFRPKCREGEQSLHYVTTLADPAFSSYYAWIEPPGWTPRWAERARIQSIIEEATDGGRRADLHFWRRVDLIENLPRQRISLHFSTPNDSEQRYSEIAVEYREGERDALDFFADAIAMAESLANPYLQGSEDGRTPGEVRGFAPVWVGNEARRWLRARAPALIQQMLVLGVRYWVPDEDPPPPPKSKPGRDALPGNRGSILNGTSRPTVWTKKL